MSKYSYKFTVNLGVHGEFFEWIDLVEMWNIPQDYLETLSPADLEAKLKQVWEEFRDLNVGGSVEPLHSNSLEKEQFLMGSSEG